MCEELKPCPFCNFTREKYAAHKRKVPDAQPYSTYAPEMFEEQRLVDGWQVHCQNCGVTFLFQLRDKAAVIEMFNTREE